MAAMPLVVNGEPVDATILAREAENLRQRFQQLSEEQKQQYGLEPGSLEQTAIEWARDNVIEQTLLRQAALEDPAPLDNEMVDQAFREVFERHGGVDKSTEVGLDEDQIRADIAVRLRVDRLIATVTATAQRPRLKDLADFYRRNKDRFHRKETVRAAHIVKNVEKDRTPQQARAEIEDLYVQLQQGRSFEDVANGQSDCPGNGGDLGYFPRGQMVKEFEDVVFNLRVGETSGVFRTVFGFHIAKLLDHRPAGLRPFAEVKDSIQQELFEQRRTRLLEQYVDRLRESATIEDRERAGDQAARLEAS